MEKIEKIENAEISRGTLSKNQAIGYGVVLLVLIVLIFFGVPLFLIFFLIALGVIRLILPLILVPKHPLVFTENGLTYKGGVIAKSISVPYHSISVIVIEEGGITIVDNGGRKIVIDRANLNESEWPKTVVIFSNIIKHFKIRNNIGL